jgi:pimeloyl-ACP methyl ester carboxylesterase
VWASLHRAPRPSRTAVVVVHPSSNFLGHYLLGPLAERGVDAIGLTTRYVGNDSTLIMENCVLDVGSAIAFLRERGYRSIALIGNSGGGGLAAFYQSQAESPTVRRTPAGDPPDLTEASLPPVDALVSLMAHPGRALVYTEWLDPAVVDEHDPSVRDAALDMFDERNGPPYAPGFVERYRAAQLARSRRIAAWVRDRLGEADDLPFVVHGTVADPRFLDVSLDASDRVPGTPWGPPKAANLLPATLGHHTSLRSWLSQWSVEDSNCDGPYHLARTSVPTLVVYGTADQVCFPCHARSMYEAIPHRDRRLVPVEGGTHYLQGQPELVGHVADTLVGWLESKGLRE